MWLENGGQLRCRYLRSSRRTTKHGYYKDLRINKEEVLNIK
jgi:hypothetical protein